MGTAEEPTPSKPSKGTSSAQEVPTITTVPMPSYPDWSSSMQAYYGTGATPPFFASTVASSTPYPYMWRGQHPMMPPYGTPVHYPALYPPGRVYTHPSMTGNTTSATETEGKNSPVKDQTSAKKSKGNSSIEKEKTAETRKAVSGSGDDGASQSGESGSEGSSDASDENNQQDFYSSKKGSFDQMLVDGANAQNIGGNASSQASVPGQPVVALPTTNRNLGMDLWNPSTVSAVKRDGLVPDHQWVQDERELKKQKRKQSNRESARRSRLRRQAECEELQRRVESLNNENSTLKEELGRLAAECDKLTSENDTIKDELIRVCGPDAISSLAEKNPTGEGNG